MPGWILPTGLLVLLAAVVVGFIAMAVRLGDVKHKARREQEEREHAASIVRKYEMPTVLQRERARAARRQQRRLRTKR